MGAKGAGSHARVIDESRFMNNMWKDEDLLIGSVPSQTGESHVNFGVVPG